VASHGEEKLGEEGPRFISFVAAAVSGYIRMARSIDQTLSRSLETACYPSIVPASRLMKVALRQASTRHALRVGCIRGFNAPNTRLIETSYCNGMHQRFINGAISTRAKVITLNKFSCRPARG